MRAVAAVLLLLVAVLAGCLDAVEHDAPSPPPGIGDLIVEDPADRIPRPQLPDPPQPIKLPAPDLERLRGLLPDLPRPHCPDSLLADAGEAFQPAAPAPHAVAHDGAFGCATVLGATATAHGHRIQFTPVQSPLLFVPGARVGGDVTFTTDDGPRSLADAHVLSWDASGPARVETTEPHAVTPKHLDLPLAGLPLEDLVLDREGPSRLAVLHAERPLAGPATVLHRNGTTQNGTLTLAAGPHALGGVGRVTLDHDGYESHGDEPRVRLHDVEGITVAGRAFTGMLGLHAHDARLEVHDGTLRLDAAVDQLWRGAPLLEGTLAVETAPGSITVREASGAASLEVVRVIVQEAGKTDPLLVNGTIADLAKRLLDLFTGAYVFGVYDPLVQESLRLGPGAEATFTFPADARGVRASVVTSNGGTWNGEVPQ